MGDEGGRLTILGGRYGKGNGRSILQFESIGGDQHDAGEHSGKGGGAALAALSYPWGWGGGGGGEGGGEGSAGVR